MTELDARPSGPSSPLVLQEVLEAAGKGGVLGSLDENDPDGDDEELAEDGDVGGLADQLAAAAIK